MTADRPHLDIPELSPLARLVADGIERVERQGVAAVDAICAENPEHADELRARFAALRAAGLLEGSRDFGPYRILRTLGRGGMGVVYLARDERIGRLVALKAVPYRLGSRERASRRFRREIQAVAQLRHPSIVPVYDVGEAEGTPYFTMEYVEGHTLADAVAELCDRGMAPDALDASALGPNVRGGSYVESVCRIVIEVADGLEHAHGHGVVHRDVKPSNILLDPDGRPRLFDFGLARIDGDASLTLTGDFAGTPYYVSPEQVSARGATLDPRTDVYSLGVTLFELLTLQRPFTGTTTADVLRQITVSEPPLPRRTNASIPRDLETICLTALEKDPERRYQSAAEMAADLGRFLAFRPVRARPVGTLARAWRAARRRRARSLAIALGAILVVGTPIGLVQANRAIRAEKERAIQESQRAQAEAERARQALEMARSEGARADEASAFRERWSRRTDRIDAFLLSILGTSDPLVHDRDTTVEELLRRGAARAADAFAGDPTLEGEVRLTLGKGLFNLGLYELSAEQFTATLDILRPISEEDEEEVGVLRYTTLRALSSNLLRLERYELADAVGRAGLAMARRIYGPDSSQATEMLGNWGRARYELGDEAGARRMYRRVLARRLSTEGVDPFHLGRDMTNYASVIGDEDPELQALLFSRAVELQSATPPADDFEAATALANRLWVHFYERDATPDEIVELRHALDVIRARGTQDAVAGTSVLLGMMIERQPSFDPAEVEALLRHGTDLYRELHPHGAITQVSSLLWLGQFLGEQRRPLDGMPPVLEAIAQRRKLPPDAGNPTEDFLVANLSLLLSEAGRVDEARALLEENPAALKFVPIARTNTP